MMTIDEIMTVNPVTLGTEDSVNMVNELMLEKRIRHVPVVGVDNQLLGLVTQRDILANNVAEAGAQKIKDIMRDNVFTITKNEDLRAAGIKMQDHKIGCLIVVDEGGKLAGIITDSDYVALAINLLEQLAEAEPEEPQDFDDLDETDGFTTDDGKY